MTMETEIKSVTPRPSPSDTMLERLAERMGIQAASTTVYAPPVEKDGVTVVGVAKVRWGFGGGGGQGKQGEGEGGGSGSGGGGGVSATPIGFIEIRDGEAQFRPINPWGIESAAAVALVTLASGLVAARLVKALGKLLRG